MTDSKKFDDKNSHIATVDEDIKLISIEKEMKKSYLDYAMSVIVSRALPDVRDGLKPVHRRILYAMKEGGYDSSKPHRKSARIVGDVMGKYHPHGDAAIYDSLVRMTQDFSLRLPLVNGQGNFGSMDGDNAAAMRYTEAKLAKSAEALLENIEKDTVSFTHNYDESSFEPVVLPASFPNILVNGGSGIAIGMATNIPPHNLGEVIDATVAYINNSSISQEDVNQIIPGPDFPTGGIIIGQKARKEASLTGRGSIVLRAKTHEEEIGQRQAIVVSEIPYQVNKRKLIERIAETVKLGQIEGIAELRDESDHEGVRIVVEIKRDAVYEVVLNKLFKHTSLQTTFPVNSLAINKGRPQLMNVKEILSAFVEFKEEVVIKRTIFDLNKARDRAHILAALLVAISNLDEIIKLIRSSKNPIEARTDLMATKWEASSVEEFIELIDDPSHKVIDGKYTLSETQAKAILDLRLQKLTGMEQEKLVEETKKISSDIEFCLHILSSQDRRKEIMINELLNVKTKFSTPRKTDFIDQEFEENYESLIPQEDMVVTATHSGYIKRVPLSVYRSQKRGGKGRSGMSTKDEDFVTNVFAANTHTSLLLFSSIGMCYSLKVYNLPLGTPQSKGKAMINILPLDKNETITTIMPLEEDKENFEESYIMFSTKKGTVRRNKIKDFLNIRANGKIAMKLDQSDKLINVLPCTENEDVLIVTKKGMALRFPVTAIRVFIGRNSVGVRGIKMPSDNSDQVVSMSICNHIDVEAKERTDYIGAVRSRNRIVSPDNISDENDIEKAKLLESDKFKEMSEKENFVLTVSSSGYGQLASSYDYRVTNRGGKGIANMQFRNKTDEIISSFKIIPQDDEIILVTKDGQIIRMSTNTIRQTSRNSKGVTLFNIDKKHKVVSVAHLPKDKEVDEDDLEDNLEDEKNALENDLKEKETKES